jgi:zinc transporter
MRAFLYNETKATELPFLEGAARAGQDELVWLHLDGGDPRSAAWINAQTNLADHIKSALTAVETRPRGEVLGDGILLNLRGLGTRRNDPSDLLVSVRIWAVDKVCISLSFHDSDALNSVVDRFLSGNITDSGDVLAAFAEANTELLDPEIGKLADELDACELALDKKGVFALRRVIADVRSRAIDFRRFVSPQRQALERLVISPQPWLNEDDRIHLRNAADLSARMAEELEAVRERSALMHEELTDRRAEQIDTRALLIAIVALVFLPLTFITGLLGMNVEGIPFAKEPWAFWGVVAFSATVGLLMMIYFVRAHWIARS